MSIKNNKKQQNLFHLFIQHADQLPGQSAIFPQFQFMDQSIRRKFNQLKKTTKKKQKQLTCFQQLWNELDSDDKVILYCNWTKLLIRVLQVQKNIKLKQQITSIELEDQIYIKKTSTLFNKWEKRNAKLTHNQFIILSKTKNKQFDLKDFQIRKSKSRQNFSWLLQPINKNGKPLQCGVSSQKMFDQWFNSLRTNINNQRILYFFSSITQQRLNPGSASRKFLQKNKIKNKSQEIKTLTQRVIDNHMKIQHNDQSISEQDEFQDFQEKQKTVNIDTMNSKLQEQEQKSTMNNNPNIFKKLAPYYNNIMSFADTPINSSLLHCDSDYRVYELASNSDQQIKLKYFSVLPFPKQLVFRAITSQSIGWNDQIDLLTVKTKISSENTVLIYEKNKPQGILYRERDFLYLRHCFSILNYKQKNTFMIDKSIDSIHHPPFMSVVRAQREIIWGLIQKQSGKQCMLIVQGFIKGGGYMNVTQNKDMTYKYMKKLTNLNGFIKQLSFRPKQNNLILKQDWVVDVLKQEIPRKNSNISQQKTQELQQKQRNKQTERKGSNLSENNAENAQIIQKQLAQFITRTNQQLGNQNLNKSQILLGSEQRTQMENYVPPNFFPDKSVILPNDYLKKTHTLQPIQKSKKPKYFPHFRGHHLWKGQWAILPGGGLGYIDEEKMQQQKKVLTYIIKRIGKNIFSGKGILNISLPVDIFCVQSNIQRIAMSFGYYPYYLERAASIKQPQVQLKYIVASGVSSSLIYLTMEKPFNPILGQTFQCWIDNCPVYFQQISHHPPIAAFLMKGRGYTVSGCVQAKMDLSINSGTGVNQGISKVEFQNGSTFYFTTAAGCLSGLTYGQRKLFLVGKSFFWSQGGLFLQITYNPASKNKSFFGGVKGQGDQKLADYFEGVVKQYPAQTIKQLYFKKVQDKQISAIPKGPPNVQPIKSLYKVCGRWNKYIMYGDEKIFDVDQNRYFGITEQKYPLASHSNYREDIVYRRLKNFVQSQQFKEVLQIKQREDRKHRARFHKSSHH